MVFGEFLMSGAARLCAVGKATTLDPGAGRDPAAFVANQLISTTKQEVSES
jgi:hypothetical protein